MSGMPDSVEYVCLNGDMTNFEMQRPHGRQMAYNTSDILNEVTAVFPALTADNVSIIYASHDSNATDDAGIMKCADTGMLPSSDTADHPEISEGQSGLIYTGENNAYYIYGVSYRDMMDAQSGQNAAEKFKAWVADKDPGIPVIVIGHVPVHKLRNDNKGATYWNKALNYAATGAETPESGSQILRDVIYLHGHNHSRESAEYYLSPGDRIHAEGDDEGSDLYYTYITAGYLTSSRTATLLAITDDDLIFTKYTGTAGGDEASVPKQLGERRRVHYYTVSFSEGADPQTVLEGNTAAQPQDPARSGYTFGGWYTDTSFSEKYDFTSPVTGDLMLHAKWIAEDSGNKGGAAEPEQNGTGDETASAADAGKASGSKDEGNTYSEKAVKTGDQSGIAMWIALMVTALTVLVVMSAFRIRNSSKRRL